METYGALEVIREESEGDNEDIDRREMYIQYSSQNANTSANINENIKCIAVENSNYHGNRNQNVLTDKNMHNSDAKSNESGRKKSFAPNQRLSSISLKKAKIIMEPTYRIDPFPDQYFSWYKVRNSLNKTIFPVFESFKYQSSQAGNFCKMVCNKAILTVKRKFDWPRYRYVCHVTMFPLNNQGVIVGERSLTYPGVDNNAVCVFNNKETVLIITFHGIFYE